VKLPSFRLEAPGDNLDNLPKLEGMVVSFFPGGAIVRHDGAMLLCGIAKTFRAAEGSSPLAVGDQVTVAVTRPDQASPNLSDMDRSDGMILSRRPRRTLLARPQPRSGKRRDPHAQSACEKVIVVNMDILLIVASTSQPTFNQGLIDRFLIAAQRGEMTPILVINKTDLARPDPNISAEFIELGGEVFPCSAVNGTGIDAISDRLKGHTSVLAGASGVGKSTIINAIIPNAQAATNPVRVKDNRGRHTTAAAVVYDLPAGGMIVDTPGIRELEVRLDPAQLPWFFPEFQPFALKCRFNNCTHTHEPGCEVIRAFEAGEISSRRYKGYLRLREDIIAAKGRR